MNGDRSTLLYASLAHMRSSLAGGAAAPSAKSGRRPVQYNTLACHKLACKPKHQLKSNPTNSFNLIATIDGSRPTFFLHFVLCSPMLTTV